MIAGPPEVIECERSDMYKLLSECFYPPDEKLLNKLNNLGSSDSGLASLFSEMAIPLSEIGSTTIDYAKLFIGPYKMLAPPYGSLYLENGHKLMENSTIDVLNFYRQEGLDLNLKEAPDHIAVELEFMYFLVVRELEMAKENKTEGVDEYRKKQLGFITNYFGWVREFVTAIRAHSSDGFYTKVGNATESFILNEIEFLEQGLNNYSGDEE